MERQNNIVLFDGVCNLCNGVVNFVIDRDRKSKLKFISLQDSRAQEILDKHEHGTADLSTILYIENGKLHQQSSAVLRIIKKLDGLWPILYVLMIFPKFIRDMVYRWVAKNRYKWFGKRDRCRVPESEIQTRFL
jgi:predicted DCC family thiol-disulfide oxidoreductase YuxK